MTNFAKTRNELSLLLYFETCAVDTGGKVESCRMNDDDRKLAHAWREQGFIQYGRIAFHDIKGSGLVHRDHWVVLSTLAWLEVQQQRQARCMRMHASLKIERCGFNGALRIDEDTGLFILPKGYA